MQIKIKRFLFGLHTSHYSTLVKLKKVTFEKKIIKRFLPSATKGPKKGMIKINKLNAMLK